MAIIQNKLTKDEIILHNQHTIGRHQNNVSIMQERDISRKHAVIYWENSNWYLTDFSSNGTKLNNAHIHHTTKKLEENDLIQFSNSEKGTWRLTNLDKPSSFLKPVSKNEKAIVLKEGIMALGGLECAFFKSINQSWIMDDGTDEVMLLHGNVYLINEMEYEFIENECSEETERNLDITNKACFNFFLSADEESISSNIVINDLVLDLGGQVYNHLLLQLVRVKQQDLELGMIEKFSGWIYIEDLSNILSKEMHMEIDMYYINTLIHRLRKKMMSLQPFGSLFINIIERKKGKLRFGFPNFQIEKEQLFV